MADVIFVVLLAGLFAVTAGAVAVCDRLVGPDEAVTPLAAVEEDEAQGVAA